MSQLFQAYAAYHAASRMLLENVIRNSPEHTLCKVELMQERYLNDYSVIYSEDEIKYIREYFAAIRYKFYLSVLSLEQCHALFNTKSYRLLELLDIEMLNLQFSESDLILAYHSLECFLFETGSFLDLFMRYLTLLLRSGSTKEKMTRKEFFESLKKANVTQNVMLPKVTFIEQYFTSRVFAAEASKSAPIKENWGGLLKDIRDRVAHRDIVRTRPPGNSKIIGDMPKAWLKLQGLHYNEFCQEVTNGCFALFEDLLPTMFETEWKVGKCDPTAWD